MEDPPPGAGRGGYHWGGGLSNREPGSYIYIYMCNFSKGQGVSMLFQKTILFFPHISVWGSCFLAPTRRLLLPRRLLHKTYYHLTISPAYLIISPSHHLIISSSHTALRDHSPHLCITSSSHHLITSSSHLIISSSHRIISSSHHPISSSHPLITSSSHHLITSSSHLIISSSHLIISSYHHPISSHSHHLIIPFTSHSLP